MDIGKVFSKVAGIFKGLAHDVARMFVIVFGSKAAADFAQAALALFNSDFGKVVLSVVEGLQSFAASNGGAAARASAFAEISTAAVAAGLDLKESLINMLIELALQKIKGTFDHLQSLDAPSPGNSETALGGVS